MNSINRNIVECKDRNDASGRRRSERINRNIVECKDSIRILEYDSLNVLIETSWNVKNLVKVLDLLEKASINRNIVECKGIFLPAFSASSMY